MNHKLSLKTADFYGRLLACVPEYARINFDDVFENFLDAYDADIKAEKSTPVEKPKSNRAWSPQKYKAHQRLLDCFIACKSPEEVCAAAIKLADVCKREADEQRTIPKVGEVYKDLFGHRFQIVGVFNEPYVATQTIGDNPLNEQIFQFASLKRFKFSDLTKED
ncbi:MAG: hypothetical protein IKE46_04655 [Selenomonadaceae bacterium]|nr:hypothetical protein [Selenomonadaceae bacterium]